MDDSQALAVVTVSIGPQLVFDLVGLEVGKTAHLENTILCHSGIPHEIAASLHIINVYQQPAHVHHCVFHNGQGNVIGHIVLVGVAKVGLHSMT